VNSNFPRVLDLLDLAWAFGLIAISIGLLQWQRVNLGGQILLAAGRSILQLLVMGFGLQVVWQLNQPLVTVGATCVLAIVTAIAASNRISDRMKNLLPIVIKPDNWSQPQYLLAYAGISLGYLLDTTAVAGERMISEIERHQAEIETHLSLGASPTQAIASYRQAAIKVALVPKIQMLAVAGLVTIPGFLSGEFLANVQPVNAAGYQIVALFTTICSSTIAVLLVTRGIVDRYFTRDARLRAIE
jgi:putative ABC transport system permease protein